MNRIAFGLRRLYTAFPKGFVVNMCGEAVTEKSARMGERECVLGCVQKLILLIARGLQRCSCSLTYLGPIFMTTNS